MSWRLWGVWLKTPSSSFAHWGRPSPRESAPWTRQLTPRSAPNSSSTELLSPCGGGMPSNGFTASQLSLPQRTALFNSSLFPLLTSCIVYIIFQLYIFYKLMGWATQRGPRPRLVATSHRLASCVIVSRFRTALDLDTYPLSNFIRPRCAERAKRGRGKPVLIMQIGFLACFHAISLERSRFRKIASFILCPCGTEDVGIAHKPPRSL